MNSENKERHFTDTNWIIAYKRKRCFMEINLNLKFDIIEMQS
jgi:hypothetical protein